MAQGCFFFLFLVPVIIDGIHSLRSGQRTATHAEGYGQQGELQSSYFECRGHKETSLPRETRLSAGSGIKSSMERGWSAFHAAFL